MDKNRIDWEYLMLNFGNQIATEKFEKLALYYVQDIYSDYNWVPTQRTHDGNKDIHLKEYESTENDTLGDKWAEAKYKKNSSSLKKKIWILLFYLV